MGKYRKIDTRIWNDAKFRALSKDGKLIFLFILTHPNLTALGAMRASITGLAEELQESPKAFREAFQEAFSKGMIKHDEKALFIYLPKFLKYNRPESPNVVKSWEMSLDLLPECSLKDELIYNVKAFAEGLGKAFTEALPEAFLKALPKALSKGMPNQEQEQEQEQEQKQKQKKERGPGGKKPKEEKLKMGEFQNVLLTPDELQKLEAKFGKKGTAKKIEDLSAYISSKGKKYSSHYATILSWDRKNEKEPSNGGDRWTPPEEPVWAKCPECGKETPKNDIDRLGSCPTCFKPLPPGAIKDLLKNLTKDVKSENISLEDI